MGVGFDDFGLKLGYSFLYLGVIIGIDFNI